ncbi:MULTISPECIES: sulfite exporter TauE/SafE family protein [Pseudomonas syringae group]|uniref:Probable membrane transporter protein n=1 Tax=Pseudomonas lijiangensis TaxID=2995658 RepID=A0ABX8HMK4_9PSED|nr:MULTISPECIES: sulfite exporter TauE/SafE family protein [Pseudomonas syringae group]MBX8499986.1 sulfite exporter TauE/SafE family protein [Pseudomonas lijiangensis]MBX8503743.1 sulfite exporter TauE/SafE family protein [Pseudomonas lijiangensis]MBX8533473.1 sulfite exporter TauE/SafE family protein [Pseudomonas cichorii]MBX8603957.1 sulfite exporter TauE/SafE family protein [Pseudomonas cichorii]QWU81859.1 sulfite exporter TauE/SafE family protein [Pseudomonas lijiangensis]
MIEVVMFVLMGAAMGTLGGLFGIGGGLVAIPALGVLFGLDQQLAQGTALLMVLPNVLLALWRYNQRNRVLLRNALMLIVPSFFLAWLTSLLAVRVDPQHMRLGFVIFLILLTIFNLAQMFSRKSQASTQLRHVNWLWLLGVGSGVTGGLFGVGGGVVATPILTSVFGATQVVAQGLALTLAVPSTAITLFTYALHDHVNWSMGIPLAIGGLASVSWGVRLAHSMPERLLRYLFCLFLVFCAVILMFKL